MKYKWSYNYDWVAVDSHSIALIDTYRFKGASVITRTTFIKKAVEVYINELEKKSV